MKLNFHYKRNSELRTLQFRSHRVLHKFTIQNTMFNERLPIVQYIDEPLFPLGALRRKRINQVHEEQALRVLDPEYR